MLLHGAALALGWIAFVALWIGVLRGAGAPRELVWLASGALLVIPLLTLAWVAHNLSIYRRLGPRRGLRQMEPAYDADFVGRRVVADWAALRGAHRVEISFDNDGAVKRYAASP